jgi:regulator of sirC expression with transglutaminase-like and TPR domain
MSQPLRFPAHHNAVRAAVFFATLTLSALSCSTKKNNESITGEMTAIPRADTLSLERACQIMASHPPVEFGASDAGSANAFYRLLDSAAEAIRLSPLFKPGAGSTRTAIIDLVYQTWHIGFDSTDTALETLLPDRVFRTRKGDCLGVSLILLMLAERLGCPIYGVMLPGHFFCRYDDGRVRINIEPNRGGCAHDDAYYRERYQIAKTPWYDLKNLSRPEVIGVLCYDCGTLCLREKLFKPAIVYFRECLRLIPGYAEAKGNLAVAYAQNESRDTAMDLFAQLFVEHPDMVNLAANYGAVAAAARQYHKALTIYLSGLERNPGDSLLYRRAVYTFGKLGNDDSTKIFGQKLLAIKAMAK